MFSRVGTYKERINNFCWDYALRNNLAKLSDAFSPDKSLSEMFKYLRNIDGVDRFFDVQVDKPKKDDEESIALRTEGNLFFKKRQYDKAIVCYNDSILMATHPQFRSTKITDSTEQSEEPVNVRYDFNNRTFETLTSAYANRSAAFYYLKQYRPCISDCDLAFKFGCSKSIVPKLYERKANCYIALGEIQLAEDTLVEALHKIKKSEIDSEKSQSVVENMKKLLSKCLNIRDRTRRERQDVEQSSYKIGDLYVHEYFQEYKTEAPKLTEVNSQVPTLSSAVRVAYSPSKGRHLIANRDISTGEVLGVANNYAEYIKFAYMKTHCSSCFRRTITPLPCPSCSKVVFCSEECRLEALQKFHLTECNLLDALEALNFGECPVLALRIMVVTSAKKITTMFEELESRNISSNFQGCNENGIYNSDDYRTIYHLETNQSQMSNDELMFTTAVAYMILRLLINGNTFFHDENNKFIQPTSDEINILGAMILRHSLQMFCNAMDIVEMLNYQLSKEFAFVSVGGYISSTISLINHSCVPQSAVFHTTPHQTALESKCTISAGSEITIHYDYSFLCDVFERRSRLKSRLHFTCRCDACLFHWPSDLRMTKFQIKCIMCSGVIDMNTKECCSCGMLYNKIVKANNNELYLPAFFHKLNRFESKLSAVRDRIIADKSTTDDYAFLKEFINHLKYVHLPNKLFCELQFLYDFYNRQKGIMFYKCSSKSRSSMIDPSECLHFLAFLMLMRESQRNFADFTYF